MQTQGLVAESLVSPRKCCAGLFNHGGKASKQLQLFWGSNCWVPQSTSLSLCCQLHLQLSLVRENPSLCVGAFRLQKTGVFTAPCTHACTGGLVEPQVLIHEDSMATHESLSHRVSPAWRWSPSCCSGICRDPPLLLHHTTPDFPDHSCKAFPGFTIESVSS